MLTITITGERAEGKTQLAFFIAKMLEKLDVGYDINMTEAPSTYAETQTLNKQYSRMLAEDVVDQMRKESRRVSIVVINTRHLYTKEKLDAVFKSR